MPIGIWLKVLACLLHHRYLKAHVSAFSPVKGHHLVLASAINHSGLGHFIPIAAFGSISYISSALRYILILAIGSGLSAVNPTW